MRQNTPRHLKATLPQSPAAAHESDPKRDALDALLKVLDEAPLPPDAIEVAKVGEAYGLKGDFHVIAHSPDPEALFSSKRWFLQIKQGSQLRSVILPIKDTKDHRDGVVAQSLHLTDRNAAQALKGARIFVPRSMFPTLPDGEYYWVDLVGLAVINREGVALGTVKELMSAGPQTTLVLEAAGADDKAVERLIPFVDAFVDGVDLPAQRITVDWQPDY
jgi:16S rRNA processing protein RimM